MSIRPAFSWPLGFGVLAALPAQAGNLQLQVQIPELSVANYQRPYMAVWIETADDSFVQTLSVWHRQLDRRGNPLANGDKFMQTLRTWWRASAATSTMPIDGVSGATRAPGTHELQFTSGKPPFTELAPGKYQLVLEVVREIKQPRPAGATDQATAPRPPKPPEAATDKPASLPPARPGSEAREELRLDFTWPVKKATTLTASGTGELGAVQVQLTP